MSQPVNSPPQGLVARLQKLEGALQQQPSVKEALNKGQTAMAKVEALEKTVADHGANIEKLISVVEKTIAALGI